MAEEKAQGTTVAVKPHDKFRAALLARRDEFAAALAGRMDPDHFVEVAMTAYLANPDLANPQKCSQISLFGALRRAAQLKLRPDGEEAAIIPYRGEAQFQPMFRGIVRTMLRTRTVLKVEAHEVRTADVWDYELGLTPKLRHVPGPSDRRGDVTHVYAIVWLTNGQTQFEVMDRAALDEIQKEAERQRGGRSTPAWDKHPGEMRRKVVVKRLAKYLEMDPEQAAVLRYDDAMDAGKDVEPGELIPEAEWRTVDQRVKDHADRQAEELRRSVEAMNGKATGEVEPTSIAEQLVGFGKYRDRTWAEVLEKQRGYVTHYVVGGTCPHVSDDVKAALVEWLASMEPKAEGEEKIPDPGIMTALRERGANALLALRKTNAITDDAMEGFSADLSMMKDGGDFHGLTDAVDELERRASAASGDLFGGAS